MLKSRIQIKFNHQYNAIVHFDGDIHIADYTEQTKTLPLKRGVVFCSPNAPVDIDCFRVANLPNLPIGGIEFNNLSFVHRNGRPKSQCEAVFFPQSSTDQSWILFCELKYSSKPLNNVNNLRKAIKQLVKTRYYYFQDGIFEPTNVSYLIASLPQQSEPFANFSVPQAFLLNLKRTRNIILRMKNSVEIVDHKIIHV
jgi:hypothetical protein